MVKSAGNIDSVLVSYDTKGRMDNFASLVVQWVYISDNLTGEHGASRPLPAGRQYLRKNQPHSKKTWAQQQAKKGKTGVPIRLPEP